MSAAPIRIHPSLLVLESVTIQVPAHIMAYLRQVKVRLPEMELEQAIETLFAAEAAPFLDRVLVGPARIYTVGYAGSTPAQLLARIRAVEGVLVDIRYSRTSRRPEWRNAALHRACTAAAVTKLDLPSLGNVNFKNGGPIALASEEAGLEALEHILGTVYRYQARSAVLLCVCGDPAICHRTVVAERLAARGWSVEELPA